MRNFILIFSLFIFAHTAVNAQEYLNFGAKGGLNLSNMNSEYISDDKMRIGFHLGLLAEIPLTSRFAIQPEVLYSTQGTEDIINNVGFTTIKFKLDYIQVPILAKIYLTESLSVELGPSLNFLVNESIDFGETDFGNSFEFGGALGASYKLRGGFFVSARYIYGFTDAFDRDNINAYYGDLYSKKSHNYGLQLGVGFMF